MVDNVIAAFENQEMTVDEFLDVIKILTLFNHSILLQKLFHPVLEDLWFVSYLGNRQQLAENKNALSLTLRSVPYSVPQDSILDPFLFDIYKQL